MPYIRTMPDGSKKTYHTEDEFYDLFDKKWGKGRLELISEMKKIKGSKKDKFINSGKDVNNEVLAYV